MTVGAIGQSYGGFYQVHNISGISLVDKIDLRKQAEEKTSQAEGQGAALQAEPERKKLSDIKLQDVKEQFPGDYGYIGKDKDINNLDVEKAVFDMRKDRMLEQYQFFVDAKAADDVLFNSGDGVVIRK